MNFYVLTTETVEQGESGEQCGSKYELEAACKVCGTGAKLIGKLFTKGLTKAKEDIFCTTNGDLIISSDLFVSLERNRIVLKDVAEVFDHRGERLPLYHLNPQYSFPKMLPESEGLIMDSQCQACRQNGYFNDVIIGNLEKNIRTYVKPFAFHYPRIEGTILSGSDIFHTWEHMGYSSLKAEGNGVVRYARPLLIVSEKLKDLFERLEIRKLMFSLVLFHDAAKEN